MTQPETVVYKAKFGKSLVLGLIFSAMGYTGYLGVSAGAKPAWAAVGLGVLGVVFAILRIIPGSTYLKLTTEGFTARVIWRTAFIPWSDIKEFDVSSPRLFVHQVVYRLTASRKGAMNRVARSLMTYDGAIPPEFGVRHDVLLTILQDYLKEVPKVSAEYTAPLTLEEQIAADRQKSASAGPRFLRPKPVLIFTAVILLILAVLNKDLILRTFSGAKTAVSGGMDATFEKVYREKFMKECMKTEGSAQKVQFCECCADATMAKYSREQLMKNDPAAIADMEKTILPGCAEKFLDNDGDDAEKPADEEPDGAKPEVNKTTQKLEALIASRPVPVIPKAAPAVKKTDTALKEVEEAAVQKKESEPVDTGDLSSIYLTNGQVMTCRILSRDKNGVWIEVAGGKAYFGNSEIKKISKAS